MLKANQLILILNTIFSSTVIYCTLVGHISFGHGVAFPLLAPF